MVIDIMEMNNIQLEKFKAIRFNVRMIFFVVCVSGYYGKNCNNQCSINCYMNRSCDRVTGECDGGCKPGWTGINCDWGKYNLSLLHDYDFKVITRYLRDACKIKYL